MSFVPSPGVVPDRDRLPLKKRDQRCFISPQQQQNDAQTFKVPYPYRSQSEFKAKATSPFQPVPRRVPAVYHTHAPSRSKPYGLSAFREHYGWAECRDFAPLHPGWGFPLPFQHHSYFPIQPRDFSLPLSHIPHPPTRFGPAPPVADGLHGLAGEHGWEQLKLCGDKSLYTERQRNGRSKRRTEGSVEGFSRVKRADPSSLSLCLPQSHEDLTSHSFLPSDLDNTCSSVTEDASRSVILPSPQQADTPSSSSSSSSSNRFPWLLPHFVAGSLIELRDGRLRRVEHLQTEDFLLGSLACPDLRLSCCTVQSISPAASSISRLLILLHDQQSQEVVDVYVEYPFFVRGRGWSSCCPQKTARLCGLQCRQLSVGDVCLALTPVSTPPPLQSKPKTSPRKSEGASAPSRNPPCPQVAPKQSVGQRRETEVVRRRHYSAPEVVRS